LFIRSVRILSILYYKTIGKETVELILSIDLNRTVSRFSTVQKILKVFFIIYRSILLTVDRNWISIFINRYIKFVYIFRDITIINNLQ